MEKQESDLVERYLDNSLTKTEKSSFEKKLNNSSELREEIKHGKDIIDGIKQARVRELKDMLNGVVVGGPLSSASGQAALAVLSASLVSLIVYFSIRTKKPEHVSPSEINNSVMSSRHLSPSRPLNDDGNTTKEKTAEHIIAVKKYSAVGTVELNSKTTLPSTKEHGLKSTPPSPPINSSDSFLDNLSTPAEKPIHHPSNPTERKDLTLLSYPIEVELDSKNKKYNFHYQFLESKLFLYGPFVKNLYELIENNKKEFTALYLHYKGAYYYLGKSKTNNTAVPMPLVQITDEKLIEKLGIGKSRKKQ